MANEDNLKPWKKGQSGNQAGRPKGTRNRSAVAKAMLNMIMVSEDPMDSIGKEHIAEIAEALGKTPEEIAMIEANAEEFITLAMIAKAKAGDVMAYRALLDSAYGTPKQTIEQTNTQLKPPKIRFTNRTKKPDAEE